MNIPEQLLYTKDHEWVRREGDDIVIGITDFAQSELGDVVFVQLPAVGNTLKQGDTLGTIEAVKAVADIYAPVSAKVLAVNTDLNDTPDLMNQDPYGRGWIAKLRVSNWDAESGELMNAADYLKLTSA